MPGGGTHNHRLLIDAVALERRVALLENPDQGNERLSRIWIDRGGPARFDVHLGRITKVLPELSAAMVALDGVSDGMLPLDRASGPLHEGQWVLVQISRLGFEDKGVKLTGRIAIEGAGMILRPGGRVIELPRKLKDDTKRTELAAHLKSIRADDDGLMLRSIALEWDASAIEGEYRLLKSQWQKAQAALANPTRPLLVCKAQSDLDQMIERHLMAGGECIVDGTDEFVRLRGELKARGCADTNLKRHTGVLLLFDDQDVEAALCDALNPRVNLGGGGWIAIDQATALCAIDVNAGGSDAGREAEARAIDLNLRAADEIIHQIRLRNIGGLIVIDPLRMKSKAGRDKFDNAIKQAFGAELDGAVQIGGFTRLGLYELSRQRAGESLAAQILAKPDHLRLTGSSSLNAIWRSVIAEARNGMAGAMVLAVAPRMATRLVDSADAIQILSKEFGVAPELKADPTLDEDAYRLEKK